MEKKKLFIYGVGGLADYAGYVFENDSDFEVRNDRDFIYVKLFASGDYEIAESYLHVAADLSGFPTTRNGGIIINKMDNQLVFNPAVKEYSYKFPLNSFGDSFIVGAYSVFELGKKQEKLWAGDQSGRQWSYFE